MSNIVIHTHTHTVTLLDPFHLILLVVLTWFYFWLFLVGQRGWEVVFCIRPNLIEMGESFKGKQEGISSVIGANFTLK